MVQIEQRDERDTIAEIEEAEIEAEVERRLKDRSLGASEPQSNLAFTRVIIWCLEADSVAKVGLRLHIVAAKLGIDVGRGMSNNDLAELMGFRRSAANKLSCQFSDIFGIKGPHDRTEHVRQKNRDAWRRSNGGSRAISGARFSTQE